MSISLMSPAERRRIVEDWNDTARPVPALPLPAVFEQRAAESPDAVAVAHGDRAWSYAQLDRRANGLAHALRARGVADGSRVAILLERSFELVVAELAILKCGGTYVPLDMSHPAERLRFLLEDSGVSLAVARKDTLDPALCGIVDVVDAAESAGDELVPPPSGVTDRDAAYVMYTSGSSGQPKGVMVPHSGVIRLAIDNGFMACGPDDAVAFASNVSFDSSTLEIWAPLLNGARVVVIDQDTLLSPASFAACLEQQGVTALWMTVGLFNQYADAMFDAFARLRYLIVGGDALDATVIRRVLANGRPAHLVNGYGPTEATTFAATHEIVDVAADARSVPIGRPIGNTRIYILDSQGEPVPVGVVGELHVGGAGVALGYLNRPELTAERFVASPFVAGDRLYKTGDLGRWLPDGTIDFAGRNDGQVKLRGFRVEVGEIEACLRGHAGVGQTAVVVREDAGDKQLVAYYTASDDAPPTVEALRAHLSAQLPEYMIPAAYVVLESLPLSPNGKIDRKALPAVGASAFATASYEAPQGEIERALAELWAGLLKLERIGRHDDFFALGGHSLLAVRVVNAIRRMRSIDISVREVFARPVLSDLAAFVQAASAAELPAIARAERPERIPLSFSQQRLWFLSQIDGARAAYHTPLAVQLRGNLDHDVLRRSLDRIVFRHEVLRTTFDVVDGMPVQRVQPAEGAHLPMSESDLRGHADLETELDRLVAAEAKAPFDLVNGPVIRGRLVREAESTFTLLLTMHHIVADGWSILVLLDELSAIYHAFAKGLPDPLPPLAVQYADYALWQRAWMDADVLAEQARYWKETLTGAPALLKLPTDRPRPVKQDHRGSFGRIALDEELTSKIRELSRRHDTTVFMTLLTAWTIVLARLTGQDDVVVGTPVANRGYPEIEPLIGFFVNSLVLRLNLAGSPTVAELLAQVKDRTLSAQQHQDIPFEQVVELVNPVRSLAYNPLFQNLFAWNNRPQWELDLPGLECGGGHRSPPSAVKFDITLSLQELGPRIVGGFEYATALWDATTIARFGEYLRAVITAMVADDAQQIDRIPVMPPAEREQVVTTWNDTARPLADTTLAELFERQAARTPDAPAVVDGERTWTYAELNRRADQLAGVLQARGVTEGARVAILLERSFELIAAEVAVLKCGAAYVPLDGALPVERLRFLLEDSGVSLAVARAARLSADVSGIVGIVDVDAPCDDAAVMPQPRIDGDAAAYVMYTSGSSGQPKGVVVPHRAVIRLAVDNGFLACEPADAVAFASNVSFDASTLEVWLPLLNGARVVIVDQDTVFAPAAFGELLERRGVTVLWLTVGLFNQYADVLLDAFARLRYLIVGGDALDAAVIRRVLSSGRPRHLLNGYGPTEATTFTTTHEIADVAEDAHTVPIGRPIGNTRVYVLDPRGEPVPIGVAGELHVGGAGVALGYLNRPELTAERFVRDPFSADPSARLYKTGDLARWLPDGTLDFVGRDDGQVKLRGFRVELGEIEACLQEDAAVAQAAAVVREDHGDKQLVAYYVAAAGAAAPDADQLRSYLSGRLPEYMIPAAYVRLDALPLTQNGKLDRDALPAPEASAFASASYEAPQGETECALAAIWAELLKLDRISRHDNFFALGGHSLLVVRAANAIRRDRRVDVSVGELFARPVLKDLAAFVHDAPAAEPPAVVRGQRRDGVPLSAAQLLLWPSVRDGAGGSRNVPFAVHVEGNLNVVALRAALQRVLTRHEALRTTFGEVDGTPLRTVVPADKARFTMQIHDLRKASDPGAELLRITDEEAAAPFDLENGPVVRGRLVRKAERSFTLLITLHELVTDDRTVGVFLTELRALYDALVAGKPDPLPPADADHAAPPGAAAAPELPASWLLEPHGAGAASARR